MSHSAESTCCAGLTAATTFVSAEGACRAVVANPHATIHAYEPSVLRDLRFHSQCCSHSGCRSDTNECNGLGRTHYGLDQCFCTILVNRTPVVVQMVVFHPSRLTTLAVLAVFGTKPYGSISVAGCLEKLS